MATQALGLRRVWPRRDLVALGLAVALLFVLVRGLGVGESATAQQFALVFTAIVAEAIPFVLLGALVAAVMEVYVPDRVFAFVGRLPLPMQVPVAALGGFAFPVCECGSVPVARRLISKGLHPSAGLSFMLASPIFNPIVLAATWIAYRPRGLGLQMVLGRAGLGLLIAMVAAWVVDSDAAKGLLRTRGDEHCHDDCCSTKTASFSSHLTEEFFYMGKFLILGAALAASMQALVPQSLIAGAAAYPVFATLALMGLAFLSSLCSEADAFVAVSFTPFPLSSQLGFLVFGPLFDFKLLFMYRATFNRAVVAALAVIALTATLAGALWFEVMVT